jgi:hypothetical protein
MELDQITAIRDHLIELLDGRSAHIDVASALDGFPLDRINDKVAGSPHTAWQLLEHIRLAQWDILDFSVNADYKEMAFPDDYWPTSDATEDDWKRSAAQVLADLDTMRGLVRDPNSDLFKLLEHGTGQTLLREAMLVADHNAYHLGQLMLLRRMFESS